MKKLSSLEVDIVIEWRCACDDKAMCRGNHSVPREGARELARALGRLAAQRDRARAVARNEHQRLSSAGNSTTLLDAEPV